MGDVGDTFRAHKEYMRDLKREHGIDCPGCKKRFPKAHPKILLPGQRCFCGYRDTRPRLDQDVQP
jgi:hypothetical protein